MAQPKGSTGNPYGRPKGSANKTTIEFKQGITNLVNYAAPKMTEWLEQIAEGWRINHLGERVPHKDGPDPEKALDMVNKLAEFGYAKHSRVETKNENATVDKIQFGWEE